MADAVARVMTALLFNLETKSKAYKSPSLGALFLMNNVHYMVGGWGRLGKWVGQVCWKGRQGST